MGMSFARFKRFKLRTLFIVTAIVAVMVLAATNLSVSLHWSPRHKFYLLDVQVDKEAAASSRDSVFLINYMGYTPPSDFALVIFGWRICDLRPPEPPSPDSKQWKIVPVEPGS